MGYAENPHVALLAFPFGTHAAPLFSLARALAAAAPTAGFSFVSSARTNASLSKSGGEPLPNLRIYNVSDGCPDGHVAARDDPEEEVRMFMRATPGNYRQAVEAAAAGGGGAMVTCVVSDAFLWFIGEMAAEMGAPWVPLWTGGPCSLSAHLYTDLLRRKIRGGALALSDEELDFVPGLSGLRVRDLPEGIVFGDLNGAFACLLHRMGLELPRSAAAVAINSFSGLHPALDADFAAKFKRSLQIGPLNLLSGRPEQTEPDRFGCLSWLDRHAATSVAYVSFGTIASLPPAEFAELAAGLEASGGPFLWSLRDPDRALLPTGFLNRVTGRGMVVSWAPQVEVLGHVAVGAFVTHCGWNSVLESVTSGVPMVCRPFLGDQRMNAQVVSHVWGVGIGLEGEVMTRDGIVKALSAVLGGPEGKKMRERVEGMRTMAVQAVEPGGSSTQNFNTLLEVVVGRGA